jgi:hypothetical protein
VTFFKPVRSQVTNYSNNYYIEYHLVNLDLVFCAFPVRIHSSTFAASSVVSAPLAPTEPPPEGLAVRPREPAVADVGDGPGDGAAHAILQHVRHARGSVQVKFAEETT